LSEQRSANPYAAPRGDVGGAEPASQITAVVISAAIGIGVAYISVVIVSVVCLWRFVLQGASPENAYALTYQSMGYLLGAHASGFASSAIGGYWSAALSSERRLRAALLAGCFVSAFALLQVLWPYDLPVPFWSVLASVVIPIPAFPLGAWYWLRSRGRL
jgi:hypothetical protein